MLNAFGGSTGLQMRHKPPRRRVMAKLRSDRSDAIGPNQVWAMDWMYDELFDGRRLWVLTVVDTWSRVSGHAGPSIGDGNGDHRYARASATTVWSSKGDPRRQGSQFTSKELDLWAYTNGITLDFSRPGKPTENAYVESFNATVRLECLGRHWFPDLDDAREKVEEWRIEYNKVRPHSAIGDRSLCP